MGKLHEGVGGSVKRLENDMESLLCMLRFYGGRGRHKYEKAGS